MTKNKLLGILLVMWTIALSLSTQWTYANCYEVTSFGRPISNSKYNPDGIKNTIFVDSDSKKIVAQEIFWSNYFEETVDNSNGVTVNGVKVETVTQSFSWNENGDYEITTGSVLSCNDWLQTATWSTRLMLVTDFYLDKIYDDFKLNNISTKEQRLKRLSQRLLRFKVKYATYNFNDWYTWTEALKVNEKSLAKLSTFRIDVLWLWTALGQYTFHHSILDSLTK